MKSSQRRSLKLPAANPLAPLTEAQTAFATVLGQCLAKEWMRRTAIRKASETAGITGDRFLRCRIHDTCFLRSPTPHVP